jgi:Uma2 family endonuclease
MVNNYPGFANIPKSPSLEDWMLHPPEHTEWVDGQLLEKRGMTLKHGKIQLTLGSYWRNFIISTGQGGAVYTDVPCRTNKQGRRPDISYLTPELYMQFGDYDVLPQSFPLIGEIVSRNDLAEELISKSQEYLQSGSEEVWLVFPENQWIIVVTRNRKLIFSSGQIISTQTMLPGFSVSIDEIFS